MRKGKGNTLETAICVAFVAWLYSQQVPAADQGAHLAAVRAGVTDFAVTVFGIITAIIGLLWQALFWLGMAVWAAVAPYMWNVAIAVGLVVVTVGVMAFVIRDEPVESETESQMKALKGKGLI